MNIYLTTNLLISDIINYLRMLFSFILSRKRYLKILKKYLKKDDQSKEKTAHTSRLVLNREICLLVLSRPRKPSLITGSTVRRQYAADGGHRGVLQTPKSRQSDAQWHNEQSACRISTGPVATHLCPIVSTK